KLSSLPRGTEALGFYKDKAQYAPIARLQLASQLPPADRLSYEYMDTASAAFAAYLHLRANRHDDFYIRPAGGVDVCNVQVPVRFDLEREMRAARRAPSPINRACLAVGGEAFDRLDRNWRGEFGADLVARGPFDDGVGAFAAGEDQPHPRTDLKAALAGGHEA